MPAPLVTVIILAYQQPDFLNEALASVAAQTHPAIEIVIVDDASGEEFTGRYQLPGNARLLVNETRQAFAAVSRNRAWREARGTYIAFLDQDDVWRPEKLAVQVAAMEQHAAAVMHFTHYERVDADLRALAVQNPFGGATSDPLRAILHRRVSHILCCSTVMLRRTAIDSVGAFDETIRLAADWDMWIRCAAHGRGAVLADARRLALYREHPGQWSRRSVHTAMAAARVLDKVLTWLPSKRPELGGLVRRCKAEWLRNAARGHLQESRDPAEALALLRQAAKLAPLHLRTYQLLWRAHRAARALAAPGHGP